VLPEENCPPGYVGLPVFNDCVYKSQTEGTLLSKRDPLGKREGTKKQELIAKHMQNNSFCMGTTDGRFQSEVKKTTRIRSL